MAITPSSPPASAAGSSSASPGTTPPHSSSPAASPTVLRPSRSGSARIGKLRIARNPTQIHRRRIDEVLVASPGVARQYVRQQSRVLQQQLIHLYFNVSVTFSFVISFLGGLLARCDGPFSASAFPSLHCILIYIYIIDAFDTSLITIDMSSSSSSGSSSRCATPTSGSIRGSNAGSYMGHLWRSPDLASIG